MESPELKTSSLRHGSGENELEAIEVLTGSQPVAAVVWLHGFGSDGHEFEPVVSHLLWPGAPAARFVFPHAPLIPISANGGAVTRSWCDVFEMHSVEGHDEAGVEQSIAAAGRLVQRLIADGIDSRRIVLGGFSQGAAIALQLALRFPEPLAGAFAVSSYFLSPEQMPGMRSEANRRLPVFLANGRRDPLVPFTLGEAARDKLIAMGHDVAWHEYRMAHGLRPAQLDHLSAWLQTILD